MYIDHINIYKYIYIQNINIYILYTDFKKRSCLCTREKELDRLPCWPAEGRGGQGPPLSTTLSNLPPPLLQSPPFPWPRLAPRRGMLLSQSHACEGSGVLKRSLWGALLKVLHFPNPLWICFQNKREFFFPTPCFHRGSLGNKEAARAGAQSRLSL